MTGNNLFSCYPFVLTYRPANRFKTPHNFIMKNDHSLRNHPNAKKLAKDSVTKKSILLDLAVKTSQLTAKDTDDWRRSWQTAINVDNPKRNRLLLHYQDAMVDLHLFGAIRNRKSKVLKKAFMFIDENSGEEDPELTKTFQAPWFKKFLSLSLDATYFGHSLIQFEDIIVTSGRLGFSNVVLVRREHVIPEYHRIIRDSSDDWKSGLDYLMPPLSEWCIEVGDPSDLGLLLKLVPHAISKRYMAVFWDKAGEIFGMPIRIATTTSRDPKDLMSIEDMLDNMGAAAYGLFPDGTTVTFEKSTQGDFYLVYDKRIDRANSEMSKGILGETMTMDNGSSKSQSEVHANELMNLIGDDADALRDIVNERLIPFLILKGFKLEGKRFTWNEAIQYTPTEWLEIEKMLCENYDVDPDYFQTKYGVKILGKKAAAAGAIKNFF